MMIRSSKNLSSDLECFVLEEMKGKRKRRNNEQCKSCKCKSNVKGGRIMA